IRDIANIEAVFGREQLVLGVNEGKHAGHHRQRVRGDGAGLKIRLKQGALDDIEPPCGIGHRVIGTALAEMAMLFAQDPGADLLHAICPFFCAVSSWKIDTARYGDRSVRDRAAPTESPDDLAYRDRPAAPGTTRHTDGGRGHI